MRRIGYNSMLDASLVLNRGKDRDKRIAKTAVMAIVAKVTAAAVPLITVRITRGYMGPEVYGLWSTVTSFFAIFTFSDLGLGAGLQTKLSTAIGEDDLSTAQKLVSTTALVLSFVAIIITALFIFVNPFVDWVHLMNVKENGTAALTAQVVLAIVISKILLIPLGVTTRTQMAFQEGYINYSWDALANVFSIVVICIIAQTMLGAVWMIWLSSLVPVILPSFKTLQYFGVIRKEARPRVKYWSTSMAKQLFSMGLSFMLLSVVTSLGLSLDTFIAGKFSNLVDAGNFSILVKASALIGVGCSMLTTPLWSANGEAFARNDIAWIKKTTCRIALINLSIALFAMLFLVVFSNFVFKIIAGNEFSVSMATLIGLCLNQVLISIISPWFMILNAKGKVRVQIVSYAIFTVFSLVIKILFVPTNGVVVIPYISTICYLLIIVIPIFLFANNELKAKQVRK